MRLLAPDEEMVDGDGVAVEDPPKADEVPTDPVPTDPLLVLVTVALVYDGAMTEGVGTTEQVSQTTEEVVYTGLEMVHGQLVMVMVSLSVAV